MPWVLPVARPRALGGGQGWDLHSSKRPIRGLSAPCLSPAPWGSPQRRMHTRPRGGYFRPMETGTRTSSSDMIRFPI